MNDHVAILGAGSFGVALAKVVAQRAGRVTLWARHHRVVDHINQHHRHPDKLVEVRLPDNVAASSDIREALNGAATIISALPMLALRGVWQSAKPYVSENTLIVSTTKGIEDETLYFSGDVLLDVLGTRFQNQIVFLSGPSFATEVARGLPTALTIAAPHLEMARKAQAIISSDVLRTYVTNDVVGLEVAGAFKNVIAIAAGLSDGLGLGVNAKAALVTRGLAEMSRLAVAMGADQSTLSGLAGIGDLILTCYSELSRNLRVGLLLAEKRSLPDILASLGQIAEGVNSAKSIPALCEKYLVQMPISKGVYQILFESAKAEDVMTALMSRPKGLE